jgi:hypothetical protein
MDDDNQREELFSPRPFSELLPEKQREIDGNQRAKEIDQHARGRHSVLVGRPEVVSDKSVCEYEQESSLKSHFTTPASGLDAVA